MSRILAVTGATGFIGSTVARRLQNAGWRVRALVRPGSGGKLLFDVPLDQVEGSLEDALSLQRLVQGAYAVVHCAGAVRGLTLAQFNKVNVEGVARLAHVAAAQKQAPRFLLLSSLAAREPELSPYAASKRLGEDALSSAAGRMEWTVLRPPAVYGPGDKELLPLFRWMGRGIAPVLGPADARISLLYVEDLAGAVLRWLDNGEVAQGVFEVHDGRFGGYSWEDIMDTVAHLRARQILPLPIPAIALQAMASLSVLISGIGGYAPMLTPGKVRELRHRDWVCDNTALSLATGWVPQFPLEEGLRRTPGWMKRSAA